MKLLFNCAWFYDVEKALLMRLSHHAVCVFCYSSLPSRDIQQLLSVSFAHTDPPSLPPPTLCPPTAESKDPSTYLLLVARDPRESMARWTGEKVHIRPSAETTIAMSEIHVQVGGKG